MQRATASPGMMMTLALMFLDLDVRDVVPSVHTPTLVLHRRRDRLVNVRNGRWLAEHLPDARLVELEGDDHIAWYEGRDELLGEIQEFLTGARAVLEPERILATVLFTDIVDSTRTATELGDRRWREVLESHQRDVRRSLERFKRPRGEVDRGRVPGDVRRPGPGDSVRPRDPRVLRAARDPGPGRPAHRASARSWATTSAASPSTPPPA